jgi:hypothetical protein
MRTTKAVSIIAFMVVAGALLVLLQRMKGGQNEEEFNAL